MQSTSCASVRLNLGVYGRLEAILQNYLNYLVSVLLFRYVKKDTTRLVVFARTVTWWSYSKDQCAYTCFPNLMKYTGVEV